MTDMFTLVLIGFLGGLVTGISPCILPVLPVLFFSGAQGAREPGNSTRKSGRNGTAAAAESTVDSGGGGVAVAQRPAPPTSSRARPYLVIAGLVVSFTLVTLFGSL